jgi:hypothetical protein
MPDIERDRNGKRLYQLDMLGGDPEPVLREERKTSNRPSKGKPSRFRSTEAFEGTLLTTLSFSGGTGSGAIAEMLIRGDLECATDLVVTTADPGMENSKTYDYIAEMHERFSSVGIAHEIVKTDLYGELLRAIKRKDKRFDLPPFWTKNPITGKRGRLRQGCTSAYKIAPMNRVVRQTLAEKHGINRKSKRLGTDIVRMWIGFSAEESRRIKEANQEYIYFQYPLMALGMTKEDVAKYYRRINRKLPPRSVCNGCFANDLQYFKQMFENRRDDWEQAVTVDDAIRDLTFMNVKDECYVSSTLIPLRDLPALDFRPKDENLRLFDDIQCQSGFCFV